MPAVRRPRIRRRGVRCSALSDLSGRTLHYHPGRAFHLHIERTVSKTATIETSKGAIVAELFDTEAPNTVANFEKLANSQ
ncbi:MAG TPA: peptidylprolyl isomerase, partial [Gemmatimonadales bacterium]